MDIPLLSIMDSFRTPNCTCTQSILNDPDLVDTRRPFQQDYQPSLLELTTLHQISTVTHSTSLCLAFPASIQQGQQAPKIQPHCAQQPDYAVPRLLEIYRKPLSWGHLAIRDKILVPNGVHYRGVPLYLFKDLKKH